MYKSDYKQQINVIQNSLKPNYNKTENIFF